MARWGRFSMALIQKFHTAMEKNDDGLGAQIERKA